MEVVYSKTSERQLLCVRTQEVVLKAQHATIRGIRSKGTKERSIFEKQILGRRE